MKEWNAKEYENSFSFVPKYGLDVMSLITKKEGSKGLDLGCGNGLLTNELSKKYDMTGIDSSKEMIELAKNNTNAKLRLLDLTKLDYDNEFDFLFSNAVMHWINDQDAVIKGMYKALKPDGELVLEFGGYLCANMVHSTLDKEFSKRGLKYNFNFYFPKISEYTSLLEKYGFIVKYAILFDRPTPLKENQDVRDWINMFVTEAFKSIDSNLKEDILNSVYNDLKGKMMHSDGLWYIDYTRIRVRAIK